MNGTLERIVMWRNLGIDGIDRCELRRTAEGYLLTGTVLGLVTDGLRPIKARYEIHCDEHWRTHRALIEQIIARDRHSLRLSSESLGRWHGDGRELPELSGCIDIDLGLTPATNTIPIRRLRLDVGKSQDVTAAWVKFPEFTIQPLRQTYTCLSKLVYRYQSASGFSAEISVDDLGLVVTYPGGWERLAAA